MYNPYGGYPWGNSERVVYVPVPPTNTPPSSPPPNPMDQIRQWKESIELLEKAFKKEDKPKDDKKKDEPNPQVINMMLLMILVSPVTGPIMSWFFHKGLSMMGGG